MRGTQSFVGTLSSTWRRPSLTALEVAWRWSFGLPAGLLVASRLKQLLAEMSAGSFDPAVLGLDKALLDDPVGALTADPTGAAGKFAHAIALLQPGLLHLAAWLAPLLLLTWVLWSSLGRTLVLRRVDRACQVRIGTLMLLQATRIVTLALVFWVWFDVVRWATRVAVSGPIADKQEPNLVAFCALCIVTTLVMFCAWAAVSWVLHIAPLLAMLGNRSALASLRAAFSLGPVRSKLVEINLVLGIVKIALLILAMVFSATPLPFQSVTTLEFLAWWWAGVAVLYLLWSDFFHVTRLVGYLDLLRFYDKA